MELNDLAVRIDRLERENRRWRRSGGALLAVVLAVVLIGAAMPQELPDVIEARSFRVIDERGDLRAGMDPEGVFVSDGISDRGADPLTGEWARMDERGFSVKDFDGNRTVRMDQNGVYVTDHGDEVVSLDRNTISFHDQFVTIPGRTTISGITLFTYGRGASLRLGVGGKPTLLDENGKQSWSAPSSLEFQCDKASAAGSEALALWKDDENSEGLLADAARIGSIAKELMRWARSNDALRVQRAIGRLEEAVIAEANGWSWPIQPSDAVREIEVAVHFCPEDRLQ